jgi:hypothetical protein
LVLYVDSVTTRLIKAEPTVEDVRVDQLRNEIINKLHRYFLMQINRVKVRIAILENELHFNPDRQYQHRHQERVIEALLWLVLYVELGPDR